MVSCQILSFYPRGSDRVKQNLNLKLPFMVLDFDAAYHMGASDLSLHMSDKQARDRSGNHACRSRTREAIVERPNVLFFKIRVN